MRNPIFKIQSGVEDCSISKSTMQLLKNRKNLFGVLFFGLNLSKKRLKTKLSKETFTMKETRLIMILIQVQIQGLL